MIYLDILDAIAAIVIIGGASIPISRFVQKHIEIRSPVIWRRHVKDRDKPKVANQTPESD